MHIHIYIPGVEAEIEVGELATGAKGHGEVRDGVVTEVELLDVLRPVAQHTRDLARQG